MTDTRTRDELWADAQENLDTHVKLAALDPDAIRAHVDRGFGGYTAVPLLSVALVALANHSAPPPIEPVTGSTLWQWVRALFVAAARPEPTALDRVDAGDRDDLAYLWNLTREWLNRAAAEGATAPDQRAFLALNIHIPGKYRSDRANGLLVGALLALTAAWDV